MRVLCRFKSGSDVPEEIRPGWFSESTSFPVEVGKIYTVYAIVYHSRQPLLKYLIADEWGEHFFCPADLFELVDGQIPDFWGCAEYSAGMYPYKIQGYPRILDHTHYVGLLEQEPKDFSIFSQAKQEIDDSLWRDGEQTVLNELLRLNGIPADASGFRVARREWLPGSLKTWFFSSPFSGNRASREPTVSATVRVNKGAFDGECLLLWQDGLICGTELHYLDVESPRTLESLEFKPAHS